MNQITVSVPPMFLPAIDELARMAQAGSREQWLTQVVRGIVFDFQTRKEFGPQYDARMRQLASLWPTGIPFPPMGGRPQ